MVSLPISSLLTAAENRAEQAFRVKKTKGSFVTDANVLFFVSFGIILFFSSFFHTFTHTTTMYLTRNHFIHVFDINLLASQNTQDSISL